MIYKLLEGQLAVVIGGGKIATRKVAQLHEAGARVRVVSPTISDSIMADERVEMAFSESHLEGAAIVMIATDNPKTNRRAAAAARRLGIPVNSADDPENCDFFLPATVRRGDMTLAVSTGGTCPGFASLVRQRLEGQYGTEWGRALEVIASARRFARARGLDWAPLLDDSLLAACASEDRVSVERLLVGVLGPNVTLDSLGVDWS